MRAVQTHRGGWKEEQTRPWTPAPILHISAYKQRLAYRLCTFARVLGDVDAELNDVAGEDLAGRTLLRAATQPLAVDEGAVAAFSVLQVELTHIHTHTHEQNQYGFLVKNQWRNVEKNIWQDDRQLSAAAHFTTHFQTINHTIFTNQYSQSHYQEQDDNQW